MSKPPNKSNKSTESSESDRIFRNDAENLRQHFDRDGRFEFLGIVDRGGFGVAVRVRYTKPKPGVSSNFIVKRALDEGSEQRALIKEAEILDSLKGAMHIVQPVEIDNNPLLNPPTKDLPEIKGTWSIVEYLENGTLASFIEKAGKHKNRLPNRLLWRFLLCLTKALVALTYPHYLNPNANPILQEQIPANPTRGNPIAHRDLHDANIMIGDVLLDAEHTITPQLKVIDFDDADKIEPGNPAPHLGDIGEVGDTMVRLITLGGFRFWEPKDHTSYQPRSGPPFQTRAIQLTPEGIVYSQTRWLDPDMRDLVCRMCGWEDATLPTLDHLDRFVTDAVHQRDAAYYGDVAIEQDENVKQLWHDIVYKASAT